MPTREIQKNEILRTVLALTCWEICTADGLADYMGISKRSMQGYLSKYVGARLVKRVDGVLGNGYTITNEGIRRFRKS